MFLSKRQTGQSTVEYIVLVTAVIVVIIAFVVSPTGPFASRMNSSMDAVTKQANQAAQNLVDAQQSMSVNAVLTNIIYNKADQGLCPPGQSLDPATGACS